MLLRTLLASVLCALSGCEPGDSDGDPGTAADTETDALFGDYVPMEPVTFSFGTAATVSVSLVDTDALTACAMGDHDTPPPSAARQLWVLVTNPGPGTCPSGLYDLADCDDPDPSRLPWDCTRYREWNDDGQLIADLYARTGAIRITDKDDVCGFEFEAAFDGHPTFEATFDIPYGYADQISWCLQ